MHLFLKFKYKLKNGTELVGSGLQGRLFRSHGTANVAWGESEVSAAIGRALG
ncbi:BnaC09g40610D [Brassica napus]|uniref:BnaC09g40610D protein n=1 Tax=Brassica napus TaxID=3708 RepID=A0A078FV59_BRANA|nr:BnaC09g40610D [Brassica napus]